MSLALEVGRLAAEQVERSLLPRVRAVGVEVGDRAGVVVGALEFCLEAVLSEPPFRDARPVLEERSGDVLRLAWIEVEEEDGERAGEGARTRAGREEGTAGDGTAPRDGDGRRPGGASPLGEVPLPSEAGPPPGAGGGRPGRGEAAGRDAADEGSTEGRGTR